MSGRITGPIVIAAGGTGGHFFPAEALATELEARGHSLVLMTDSRAGRRTQGVFADVPQHILPGAGIAGHGLARKLGSALALGRGTLAARTILSRLRPAAVVGFGGYPSVPPMLGARLLRRPGPVLVLHEGNAVLGQANAQLARFADAIATSFPNVARLPAGVATVLTGMPVRAEIAAAAHSPYPAIDADGPIRLLVWGGSLGARVFGDIVPATLASLPDALRRRLVVSQQARAEDLDRVRAAYQAAGIEAEIAPFLDNVARRLAATHLVIGRAGGSSVAELTMVGRPSIMVPLPIAASDEQSANAASMVQAGAGWMLRQPDCDAASLGALLIELLTDAPRLAAAAEASAGLGRRDAAGALADLIETTLAVSRGRDLHSAATPSIPGRANREMPA